MRRWHLSLLFVLIVVLVVACSTPPTPTPVPPTATAEPVAPTATTSPTETAVSEPTNTPLPEPTATPESITFEWPAPIEPEEKLSRNPVTDAELAAGEALANIRYPYVDYLQEAYTHQIVPEPVDPIVATEATPRREGEVDTFWILNNDKNTWSEVEMKLLGVSEHAYFWFDTARTPDPEKVQAAMAAFESVYEPVRAMFGEENVPGVDGDPHIYILHPAGTRLCNVTEERAFTCSLIGYFFGVNQIPSVVLAHSNEHEGIIMNLDSTAAPLGSEGYRETLGHEFRHLVEYWYDEQGETWESEGSAVMAEDILGFGSLNIDFANLFMADPDIQLNAWAEGSLSAAHYGQGYVINRYIFDRFGPEFYSAWVKDPDGGLQGLSEFLAEQGFDLTGMDVWLDWLTALVLHDNPNAPEIYRFGEDFPIDPVGYTTIAGFPKTIEDDVKQYAMDVYRFNSAQDLTVSFTGTTKTSVIGRLPVSGQSFWYSGRVSGALPRLTREFDLTGVSSATLQYSTFYKFSNAFGFGYVLVSTDGGETWTGLVGENMRGDEPQHDPLELALTDRFYTSVSPGGKWIEETIDLTPYAGQKILIRFESDGNDRSLGFALDNIAIPEIGFFDDAESDMGWESEGWVRTTAYIPQTFHLRLITFDEGGVPVVTDLPLNEDNTAVFDITGLTENNNEAFLIVAASAPHTLESAAYTFEVTQK